MPQKESEIMIVTVGEFKNESGILLVSDPCYEPGTWCTGIVAAKKGTWVAKVVRIDGIVAGLFCHHVDRQDFPREQGGWESVRLNARDGLAGVDSGQCGIFDEAEFGSMFEREGTSGDFYKGCCDKTIRTEAGGGVFDWGAVSQSGCGDGGYGVYRLTDEFVATAIIINFAMWTDSVPRGDEECLI